MTVIINGDTGISPVTASGTSASVDGMTVGRGGGEIATNTAVGASALNANTTAAGNTAIGYNAGTNNTATNITAVGRSALSANTTGNNNTAVGYAASILNTTGASNASFGHSALYNTTTGSYNVAVGQSALQSNTTASNNTAVGYQAAYSNQTGASITAVGYKALYAATGNNNTAIGKESGLSTTTGTNNAFFGAFAAYANTTGANNVSLGYEALQANTTASSNTAVGYQAGYANTTGTGNLFVGKQAGSATTTGSYNTFVGGGVNGSGEAITTGTKNTILGSYSGNQGGLDIRTASNYIVLSDGDGNPRGYFNGNGTFTVQNNSDNCFDARTTNTGGIAHYRADYQSASGAAYFGFFVYNGTAVGQITSTGSTTLYTSLSDQRLKENIVDSSSGLAKLSNVKVRSFDWKTNKEKVDFGLVAQELNEVAPEAVVAGVDKEDGSIDKPWQVDTSALVPAVIKAIQELKAEVDSLKQQLGK